MTTRATTTLICDRCGASVEFTPGAPRAPGTRFCELTLRPAGGGTAFGPKDVCQDCEKAFQRWWGMNPDMPRPVLDAETLASMEARAAPKPLPAGAAPGSLSSHPRFQTPARRT